VLEYDTLHWHASCCISVGMEPKKTRKKKEAAIGTAVVIPNKHQAEAEAAFHAGKRYQYHAWHRRAGKDWFGMHLAAQQARKEIGTYWHLLPKHIQAKRAIWNGIDHKTGRRFLELFFPDAKSVNNTEMFIELECGSTWQLLGSDNYDRMVGSNPRGVVFSEWALCDPNAWDYIRPILRANNGWAIFISTFRGRNHAYQMYENLKTNPDWYVALKTIEDTGIISESDVEADRVTGMSERLIQQEYYCKPAPPLSLGAYARVIDALESAGSIRAMPDTARINATNYISVALYEDYTAVVCCSLRGITPYIYGGKVKKKYALHEVLGGHLSELSSGDTVLVLDKELIDDAIDFGVFKLRSAIQATQVATTQFLERAIVSPTALLLATLTGAIDTQLDEDDNSELATAAVFRAFEQLAGTTFLADAWGTPPNYAAHDRAVIGYSHGR